MKMSLFGRKKSSVVGLDISSSVVKLLELSQHEGLDGAKYRVESYSVEALPPGAVVDNHIADVEAVGRTIKKAIKKSSVKVKEGSVAVSGASVITKTISMPASLSEREMEAQIEMEANQYVPYPLEEVNLDFEVLGPSEKNPEMLDVLLAACRAENVDDRVAALSIGGLNCQIVDVEAYALERACQEMASQWPNAGEDLTVALADIGASTTTLTVLHNNKTVYTREQNFGGKQLTEEIQRRYGLTLEEAATAEREGSLPKNYESEVLDPFKEVVAQQVNRAIQYFLSATPYDNVDLVVLAGGISSIPGLDELIHERLGVDTLIANPFTGMSLDAKVSAQALRHDAPAIMIACGLALRSFD